MMRYCTFAATILLLAACTGEAPPADSAAQAPSPPPQAGDPALGKAAYQRACAQCHDSGAGGAPVTGRPADWQQRSRLWEAVLFEHAAKGYLGMPAQGGQDLTDDQEVRAAAEYMLSVTRPELPHD